MPPDSTASEEKDGRGYWWFVIWPVVVVMVYVLSMGPVSKAVRKGVVNDRIFVVYHPLVQLCYWPRVGKPLRMYLHLWIPQVLTWDGGWVI